MSLRIRAQVARASRAVTAQWPIASFIAVNPLAGYEKTPFDDVHVEGIATTRPLYAYREDFRAGRITRTDLAITLRETITELAGMPPIRVGTKSHDAVDLLITELIRLDPADENDSSDTTASVADRVDQLVAKWVSAYLDQDPLWRMPHHDQGLYGAWRRLAVHDPDLPGHARRRVRSIPSDAGDALEYVLAELGCAPRDTETTMAAELSALPGWSGHIRWRAEHVGDVGLTDYLALRLCLRLVLHDTAEESAPRPTARTGASVWERAERLVSQLGGNADPAELAALARVLGLHPVRSHGATWQSACEAHYRSGLIARIAGTEGRRAGSREPVMQLVMCIDTRSEGVRRHLEAAGGVETFGLAGFFGIPMRFATHDAQGSIDALPALLRPHHAVTETPRHQTRATRRTARLQARSAAHAGWHAAETSAAAPFVLAETAGWFLGLGTLVRTLAPVWSARARHAITRLVTPPLVADVTTADAFDLVDRARLAEAALRMMGFDRFAPLVVFVGHGSTSANNLYESALDCGACGGNPGGQNARAAAAVFNDPAVREILASRGLPIPDDTFFLAAQHDTVSDRISVLDEHLVPASHEAAVADLIRRQRVAADLLTAERSSDLPGARPRRIPRVRARAHDWAEVYPELGLVGNAAMVVGPRSMTAGADLERRVFLHSYDARCDPDGAALENILTAPVVVAQWINHQYYFSSLNPTTLGAGTKTIHNAVGTLGVLSGQSGDLQRGLPWQSLGADDRLFFAPLRLSVVVQAPLEQIGRIVASNEVLHTLFHNGWISLTARADSSAPWRRYGTYGWMAPDTTTTPRGALTWTA